MKCRWNLTVDNTNQVLGGFVEVTKEMTEKQMITYVRKICRNTMLIEKGLSKYGIWSEDENDDDHSFHITANRHWHGYIDIIVYDAVKGEIIVDTAHDRYERECQKDAEEIRKFEESLRSLQSC